MPLLAGSTPAASVAVQNRKERTMTGAMSDPKNVIELQTWWLGELKTITERLIREEEKRQERVKKKTFAVLEEYRTKDDILDAYGFGCITEARKDKLMDMWDRREKELYDSPMYQAKRDLVSDLYRTAREIVEEKRRLMDAQK